MNNHKNKRGFTIVELLVVIVILATFALLSSFGYDKLKEHRLNEKSRVNAEGISSALDEIYIAGVTNDGAKGDKGEYPSIKEACLTNNSIMNQVIKYQKGVDKDVKVVYLSAADPGKFSQDLSGCEVLPDGKISISCVNGVDYPANLVNCSSTQEEINANENNDTGMVIYQPITNVRALGGSAESMDLSWQCLGEGFNSGDSDTDPTNPNLPDPNQPSPIPIGGKLNSVVLLNQYRNTKSTIRLTNGDGGLGRVGCRGFYMYYLERSGGKIKLSKAIVGKY